MEGGGVRCLCYVVVLHAIAGSSRSYIRVMVVGVRGLRGPINKKINPNYSPRCGVARFEVAWAFGSHCPRSALGVLIAIAESRSEGAFVKGPRKRINEKKCNLLSAALRSREVRGDMSAWV